MKSSIPIWAAIPTPFLESLELDEEGLRHNAKRYIALGLSGVFCNGLMGEVWALSYRERQRVVEVLVEEGRGRLGVSVVISASSIEETIAHGLHAKETGANHSVLMVPTSGPRSDAQQVAYVRYVCERIDMPVVLFNAATAAGTALTPSAFSELCAIEQVKMLKTTAYRENPYLRKATRNGVIVSDPLEEHFLGNFVAHRQPILYADPEPFLYQTLAARPVAKYLALLEAGEIERATEIRDSLAPLRTVFNKWIMDPLVRGHMPNAALKHWCELVGLSGGAVRPPIIPLTPAERAELESDLATCLRKLPHLALS